VEFLLAYSWEERFAALLQVLDGVIFAESYLLIVGEMEFRFPSALDALQGLVVMGSS
jgi:hypothetical protein